MKKRLAAGLLLLWLAAGAGAGLPDALTLEYRLEYGGVTLGTTTRVLERRGPVYRVTAHTRPRGLGRMLGVEVLEEEGEFALAGSLPRPRYYRQRQHGDKPYRRRVQFDWRAGRLRYGDGRSEPLPRLAQDTGSEWFALMLTAARGGFPLALAVTDGRRLTSYRYELAGEETLAGPWGSAPALRVRRRKPGGRGELWLWLARERGYLPLQVVRKRPGKPDTRLVLLRAQGE